MKCMSCGEYIYKGRKFNSRKGKSCRESIYKGRKFNSRIETTDEKYLSIPIYRFYIRCTRCSGK